MRPGPNPKVTTHQRTVCWGWQCNFYPVSENTPAGVWLSLNKTKVGCDFNSTLNLRWSLAHSLFSTHYPRCWLQHLCHSSQGPVQTASSLPLVLPEVAFANISTPILRPLTTYQHRELVSAEFTKAKSNCCTQVWASDAKGLVKAVLDCFWGELEILMYDD